MSTMFEFAHVRSLFSRFAPGGKHHLPHYYTYSVGNQAACLPVLVAFVVVVVGVVAQIVQTLRVQKQQQHFIYVHALL